MMTDNEMMNGSRCGVCNHDVPMEHTQVMRREYDDSITSYHMRCEYGASKLKPCEDCGYHRLLCNECADPTEGGASDD